MAKKEFTPEVKAQDADRAVESLSRFNDQLARNPLINGVLVDVEPTEDGPIRVSHGLGKVASGAIVVGADRGVFTASLSSSDRDTAELAISSGWELLERYDAVDDIDEFDFEYEANGDEDTEYMVDGLWLAGTIVPAISYKINGVDSSTLTGDGYAESYNGAGGTGQSLLIAKSSVVEESFIRFRSSLFAETSGPKFSYSTSQCSVSTTAADTDVQIVAGKWHDTTTRITEIGVLVSSAGKILTGSYFTLFRRPRPTGRKLKIWIF
jgi:hypothetical protein